MTLKQSFDTYLFNGSTYWSAKTAEFYKKNVGYFLQYLSRTGRDPDLLEPDELQRDILMEYVVFLRSKNRYDTHPDYKSMDVSGIIKANTIHSYMRAVKAFFNWLYNSGYCSYRFTEGLKLPKRDYDQIIVLTSAEVSRIDMVFDLDVPGDLRNCCIVHLMLDAGLRRREVIHLKAADILFDSNAIVINRSKGSKSRVVLLCPKLAALLRSYFAAVQPADMLFFSLEDKKQITDSVINAIFRRIIRNTGITRLHPHLLRHTFATSYIMGGGNLEMLRILLGHTEYDTTKIYLHLAAQYQLMKASIYKLDPVFFENAY